jgi:hypothetical protein
LEILIFRDDGLYACNLTIPDLSKESDAFIFRVWWALGEVQTLEKEKGTFLCRRGNFTLSAKQRNIPEKQYPWNQHCRSLKSRRILLDQPLVAELLDPYTLTCNRTFILLYCILWPSTGPPPETDASQHLNIEFLLHQVVPTSLWTIANSSFIITVPSQMIFAIIGIAVVLWT